MTTQFRQVSYITAADVDAPAAESSIDYRQDVVTTVKQKIREAFRGFLAKDQGSRFVSPLFNVHSILDEQKLEGYRKFFETVDRYRACGAGWSRPNSVAPSPSQVESAAIAAANLILAGFEPPSPMMLDDGTIGAFWRDGECYLSIDFEPDGEHPWAGTNGDAYWVGVWNAANELPPNPLRKELKLIAD